MPPKARQSKKVKDEIVVFQDENMVSSTMRVPGSGGLSENGTTRRTNNRRVNADDDTILKKPKTEDAK